MDEYSKHRAPLPRLYVIGGLIYNCVITLTLGALSWAFLNLLSTPVAP